MEQFEQIFFRKQRDYLTIDIVWKVLPAKEKFRLLLSEVIKVILNSQVEIKKT